MIIAGKSYDTDCKITTWKDDDSVVAFTGRPRTSVTEIVIHESVTSSVRVAVNVLKARSLGVHFIIGPDGSITQHADLLTERLAHAGGHNGPSVGIEIINPYYGKPGRLIPEPWIEAIPAAWADKGMYIVPTLKQLNALCELIAAITLRVPSIPLHWVGLTGKTLAMSKLPKARQERTPGIWAHTYFDHADSSFPVLFAILRLHYGMEPDGAYKTAISLASTKKKVIELP